MASPPGWHSLGFQALLGLPEISVPASFSWLGLTFSVWDGITITQGMGAAFHRVDVNLESSLLPSLLHPCVAPRTFPARTAEPGPALLTTEPAESLSSSTNSWENRTKLPALHFHSPIRFPPPVLRGKGSEEMPAAAGHAEQTQGVCLKH